MRMRVHKNMHMHMVLTCGSAGRKKHRSPTQLGPTTACKQQRHTHQSYHDVVRWFNMHLHTCCYSQLLNQDALQRQVVAEGLLRHAPT
jgi:hypothetical protein